MVGAEDGTNLIDGGKIIVSGDTSSLDTRTQLTARAITFSDAVNLSFWSVILEYLVPITWNRTFYLNCSYMLPFTDQLTVDSIKTKVKTRRRSDRSHWLVLTTQRRRVDEGRFNLNSQSFSISLKSAWNQRFQKSSKFHSAQWGRRSES